MLGLMKKIERTLFAKFTYLPSLLTGMEVQETNEWTLIKSNLATSMFNIVCDVHLSENQILPFIKQIFLEFNESPFAWWIGPSDSPTNLGQILKKNGLKKESEEHAMILKLQDFDNPLSSPCPIRLVQDLPTLIDFVKVIESHDRHASDFYNQVANLGFNSQQPYRFFVGYEGSHPVVIGSSFFTADVAGIFDLLTLEPARGKGYGTAMMRFILDNAKKEGFPYAALSASSENAFAIYERLGFNKVGSFDCYEWSGHSKAKKTN